MFLYVLQSEIKRILAPHNLKTVSSITFIKAIEEDHPALKNLKTFCRQAYIQTTDERNDLTELLIPGSSSYATMIQSSVYLYQQMKNGALYVRIETIIHLTAPSIYELEELRTKIR